MAMRPPCLPTGSPSRSVPASGGARPPQADVVPVALPAPPRLGGEPPPPEADPASDFYAFEKGARKPDGEGFADVWLKEHFAWEYKGKRKDLAAAYKQVCDYREALGNPPLLVVCDIDRFAIHTNWTTTA